MKKGILITLCIIITFFGFYSIPLPSIYAKEKIKPTIKSLTTDSIELEWQQEAATYEIKDTTGKKIWSGTEKKFKLSKLKPDQQVNLILTSHDETGSILEKTRLKAITLQSEQVLKDKEEKNKKKENKIYFPLGNANINALIHEDSIELTWTDLPDDDQEFEIYRDQKKYATVKGSTFTDTNVQSGKPYVYSIQGKKKLPKEVIEKELEKMKKQKSVTLTKQQQDTMFQETKELTLGINNIVEVDNVVPKSSSQNVTASSSDSGYIVRYDAFIAPHYAANPKCEIPLMCDEDDETSKFSGDGRGFRSWPIDQSSRIKSKTYLLKNSSGTKYTKFYRATGVTKGYNSKGKLLKTGKAPVTDIQLVSKNGWYHKVSMASSNPLFLGAPNIDVDYDGTVNDDGTFSFNYTHDQAPSHEMYVYNYPGDVCWTLFQHPLKKFWYLFNFAPSITGRAYTDNSLYCGL